MASDGPHRKRVKHYDDPGDVHELTFSCYGRQPLLTSDCLRAMLAIAINRAMAKHDFGLAAYVFMPEHVHLLVWPKSPEAKISPLLKGIKQPFSNRIRQLLEQGDRELLMRLTVRERPGKDAFRFWQEGGGYDRNLLTSKSARAAIDYLHLNPVRRGLVEEPGQWRWSSFRYYESDGMYIEPDTPTIEPLPQWFWDSR